MEMAPVSELLEALGSADLRAPALAVLRQVHDEESAAGLIAALDEAADPDQALDLMATLLRLYHREKPWDGESWWGTRPNSAGPYYQGVTWEPSKSIADALRPASRPAADVGHPKPHAAQLQR